jgi:hypothetical protein
MSEDFLYFLWQFQYFNKDDLRTTSNESLQILSVGVRNTNSGPDFHHARVLIEGIEWAGNVEIHVKSSDWHLHTHTHDRAYDSVILHIVWENDGLINRPDGSTLPTLELKTRTAPPLFRNYKALLDSNEVIPCANQFGDVPDLQKHSMLDRAMMQRLERKAEFVHELLKQNQHDWEETAYQLLAHNFGFKINSEASLRLAQGVPLKVLQKHRDNLSQIEALLMGQSGLAAENTDDYTQNLLKEYAFLAGKYDLLPHQLRPREWKYLRLRPANFPTVRLAQLAALIQQQPSLFSLFVYAENFESLRLALRVKQSEYWQKHYLFGKEASQKVAGLGQSSVENIVINTVVPLLVAYSQAKDNRDFLDKAIVLLEQLPAEKNHLTDHWEKLGLKTKTSFDSQAVIELYNHFCKSKKCLSCTIGTALLKGI